MEYVKDEQGQIKVMDEKGNFKFLPKNLVENLRLMQRMKFTPVQKPQVFELPTADAKTEVSEPAEATEAKRRGRQPVKK